jgi:hypothetical protein
MTNLIRLAILVAENPLSGRGKKMSTQVPQETNHNAIAPTLYRALELSKPLWKLALHEAIAQAKAKSAYR